MNWISWPAPAITARDCANARGEVVAHRLESGVVPARHDQLRERRGRELSEGQVGVVERPAATEHGDEFDGGREQVLGELRRIAAHGLEELDDPVLVGQVAIPELPDLIDERAPGWVMLGDRRRGPFEHGQRQGPLRVTCGGDHG